MHLAALRTTIGRRFRERTYAHRGVGALGARCFFVVCLGSVAPAVLGSVRQSSEDDIDHALGGIRPWLCVIVHLVPALQLSLQCCACAGRGRALAPSRISAEPQWGATGCSDELAHKRVAAANSVPQVFGLEYDPLLPVRRTGFSSGNVCPVKARIAGVVCANIVCVSKTTHPFLRGGFLHSSGRRSTERTCPRHSRPTRLAKFRQSRGLDVLA